MCKITIKMILAVFVVAGLLLFPKSNNMVMAGRLQRFHDLFSKTLLCFCEEREANDESPLSCVAG